MYSKVLALVLAAATLTACGAAAGEQSQQPARITTAKVDKIAAEVPSAIRDRGALQVITNAGTVPPLTFYDTDNKTPIGVEVDLANLVADVLGLRTQVTVASWENVFVGLDSGKYDAGFTNITVTEERKQKYDFATYRLDNVSFEARRGGNWKVAGAADVAGRTIAVASGTNQEKLLLDWNAQNVAKGLKPVEVKYFQNSTDYYLALQSGRIDAYLGPNPTAAYHAKSSGQTEIIGTVSGAGPTLQGEIAATTKKGNGFVQALADALNQIIADGSYRKVLDRWGLANEAVPRSEINPPGLPKS
ncbi:ABC transporter substrate-binding protein [Kutzneria sp. NPDC051319]|uniref:ABC transporter substrate-binding protein n=1 Tax=Kutzneria sp. NPDC051319 TaxID=3155047 RepID=UPI00342905B5